MPLVFKGAAPHAGRRGAVLKYDRADRSIRQARGGTRRQHDGEHRSNETLCDADPGAKTDATAHSCGLVGYFTFTAGGGISCGFISIAFIENKP